MEVKVTEGKNPTERMQLQRVEQSLPIPFDRFPAGLFHDWLKVANGSVYKHPQMVMVIRV